MAVFVLPVPESAMAAQPLTEAPPSLKLTVPVGPLPVTVAVNVTLAPKTAGFTELVSAVLLAALLTVCVSALLDDAPLLASPLYAAVMLWLPAASVEIAQDAVRIFPLPLSVAAEQPPMEVDPSLKLTDPVGALPLTVAVKVTLAPTVEGVSEVAMPVVLPVALTVCESVELLEAALLASPL